MKLNIKVNSNASKEEIIINPDQSLTVKFRVVREKGKANQKLIAMLAEYYQICKSAVKITSGKTASLKIVEIAD